MLALVAATGLRAALGWLRQELRGVNISAGTSLDEGLVWRRC